MFSREELVAIDKDWGAIHTPQAGRLLSAERSWAMARPARKAMATTKLFILNVRILSVRSTI